MTAYGATSAEDDVLGVRTAYRPVLLGEAVGWVDTGREGSPEEGG